MGVVHKLKSEVIDFILQTKKNQPRISVRKLAEMTSQTFQTRISKSSINNVLKEFALSSPVGRPSRKKKEKIFTIPLDAKTRIRQEIRKVGLSPVDEFDGDQAPESVLGLKGPDSDSAGDSSFPADAKEERLSSPDDGNEGSEKLVPEEAEKCPASPEDRQDMVSESEKPLLFGDEAVLPETPPLLDSSDMESTSLDEEFGVAMETAETAETEELENVGEESGLSLRPDPLLNAPADQNSDTAGYELQSESRPANSFDRKDNPVNAALDKPVAGAILLYAVAQALTHKSFFAQLLEDVKWSQDFSAFEPLCHAEIIYQWLEKICGVVPEVVDKSPVWPVLGFSEPLDRKAFQKKLSEVQVDDFFKIKYMTERDQLDIAVSGYRVTLREGGAFSVDALNQTLTLHSGKLISERPLNLAVCDISAQIISNLRPLLIHHLAVQENALTALRHLCLAFCSSAKHPLIKMASLLNFQGDEMAVFEVMATIPRTFLIGLPLTDPVLVRDREFLGGAIISKTNRVVAGESYRCTIRFFEGGRIFSEGGDNAAMVSDQDFKALKIIEMEDHASQKSWFLTNSEVGAIPTLLDDYARRWQSLNGQSADFSIWESQNKAQPDSSLAPEVRDLADIFVNFGQYLADKIGHWLFTSIATPDQKTAILRAICLLPGQVEEKTRQIILWLNMGKVAPEIKDKILIIFARFNQHEFVDYKGRYFYIKHY